MEASSVIIIIRILLLLGVRLPPLLGVHLLLQLLLLLPTCEASSRPLPHGLWDCPCGRLPC